MALIGRQRGGGRAFLRRLLTSSTESAQTGPATRAMFDRFTNGARRVIVMAQVSAKCRDAARIDGGDFLVGLMVAPTDEPGAAVLREAGLADDFRFSPAPGYQDLERSEGRHVPFSPELRTALEAAHRISLGSGHEVVAPLHLLLGVLDAPSSLARRMLSAQGVGPDRIVRVARGLLDRTELPGPGAPPPGRMDSPQRA